MAIWFEVWKLELKRSSRIIGKSFFLLDKESWDEDLGLAWCHQSHQDRIDDLELGDKLRIQGRLDPHQLAGTENLILLRRKEYWIWKWDTTFERQEIPPFMTELISTSVVARCSRSWESCILGYKVIFFTTCQSDLCSQSKNARNAWSFHLATYHHNVQNIFLYLAIKTPPKLFILQPHFSNISCNSLSFAVKRTKSRKYFEILSSLRMVSINWVGRARETYCYQAFEDQWQREGCSSWLCEASRTVQRQRYILPRQDHSELHPQIWEQRPWPIDIACRDSIHWVTKLQRCRGGYHWYDLQECSEE